MQVLIDTHILLWLMEDDPRLGEHARALILGASEVIASAASLWEIAIKSQIGKLAVNPERLVERMKVAGLTELSVSTRHAVESGKLPLHHRDPFDRLLVAQAMTENMCLVTADSRLKAYSDLVECV